LRSFIGRTTNGDPTHEAQNIGWAHTNHHFLDARPFNDWYNDTAMASDSYPNKTCTPLSQHSNRYTGLTKPSGTVNQRQSKYELQRNDHQYDFMQYIVPFHLTDIGSIYQTDTEKVLFIVTISISESQTDYSSGHWKNVCTINRTVFCL
jgi:hypothetical protein